MTTQTAKIHNNHIYRTGKTWADLAHEMLPRIITINVCLAVVPLLVFLVAIGTGNLKSLTDIALLTLVSAILDGIIFGLSILANKPA